MTLQRSLVLQQAVNSMLFRLKFEKVRLPGKLIFDNGLKILPGGDKCKPETVFHFQRVYTVIFYLSYR